MYNIVKILQTGLIIQNITLIANDSKLFGFDGYGLIRENRLGTRTRKFGFKVQTKYGVYSCPSLPFLRIENWAKIKDTYFVRKIGF